MRLIVTGARVGLSCLVLVTGLAAGAAACAQSLEPPLAAELPLGGEIAWTRKPSGEAISAARPERVVRERMAGGAMLDCGVTGAGTLTGCKVAAEAPQGYGFGTAALGLAGQYRVAAPTDGARVRVPVTFNAARVGGAMTLMAYPIWVQAPSLADVEAAYPTATAQGAAGKAVVRCAFDVEGRTTDCAVRSQTPAGRGFGSAALALATRFEVLHTDDDAAILPGVIVDIPVAFSAPERALGRMPDPQWLTEVSAAGADTLFPTAAREEAVRSGLGMADCLVNEKGKMTDCRVAGERPADLGFGEAAVQVAQQMRINAWSATGRTYAGRRLTVPIRLRLVNPNDPMRRTGSEASFGYKVQDFGGGRR